MSKPIITAFTFLFICVIGIFILAITELPQEEKKKKNRPPVLEQQEIEPVWSEKQITPAEESTPALPFFLSENGTETPPNPLPIEWEEPFFDILDNSKSREERNSRLYLFASTTAQTSPRVQEECLAHLSFGLVDSEKEFALQILKDSRIAEIARLVMFENLERVRSDEFMYFIVSNLSTTLPESELKKSAKQIFSQFEYQDTTSSQKKMQHLNDPKGIRNKN